MSLLRALWMPTAALAVLGHLLAGSRGGPGRPWPEVAAVPFAIPCILWEGPRALCLPCSCWVTVLEARGPRVPWAGGPDVVQSPSGKEGIAGASWGPQVETSAQPLWVGGWGPVAEGVSASAGLLPDKRMEMEKHSLGAGDYSRVVGKGPGPRPHLPKESSMDRSPYFDKVRGGAWGGRTVHPSLWSAQPRCLCL